MLIPLIVFQIGLVLAASGETCPKNGQTYTDFAGITYECRNNISVKIKCPPNSQLLEDECVPLESITDKIHEIHPKCAVNQYESIYLLGHRNPVQLTCSQPPNSIRTCVPHPSTRDNI